MMHVEVDDGGAFKTVCFLRIARRDGGIVEKTEAHRPRRLGVVSRRTGGNESILRFAGHDFVDRQLGAADCAQCRLVAAWRHRRIAIKPYHAFRPRTAPNGFDVLHRMTQGDDLDWPARSLDTGKSLKLFVLQCLFDGAQTVRTLGMTGGRQMVQAGPVTEENCRHHLHLNTHKPSWKWLSR